MTQYADIVFFYSFSCSVLWAYGIGLEKSFFESRPGSRFMARMPANLAITLISVFAAFKLQSRLLQPFDLGELMPMATVLVASITQTAVYAILPENVRDSSAGERVFFLGTVFLATSEGGSLVAALLIALSAVLAFGLSTVLLYSVRERIASADVRADWRGAPLILASMGLLAVVMHSADVSWWVQEAFR